MTDSTPGLVDIFRDFLASDLAMRGLVERYRRGELRFSQVAGFVNDDESTPLFRLKERCHALFRPGGGQQRAAGPREVLFDLAVGSLFHEAMKFRENLYQWEVYGPRVRALRQEAGAESDALFREFEKIFSGVSDRLEEGLSETEAILDRTREQLLVLLRGHVEDGLVARFLIERRNDVESAFGRDLDSLLEDVYADSASVYTLAGHSYLASGYYDDAERAFTGAIARGGDRAALAPSLAYAQGMSAYNRGEYAESVALLGRWAEAGSCQAPLVELAHTAVSKVERLAAGEEREQVVGAASLLSERLASLRAHAEGARGD